MRFWTAFQEPLCQAALIENGKIVRTIPDHSPKTPVRFVHIVGEFQDKLILTRRSDHQVWSLDGKTLERQIYSPYVYAAHWVGEYKGDILAGSGGLDVVYIMDLDGNIKWDWWLVDHHDKPENFRPRMREPDWLNHQLSRTLPEERLGGFNSIHKGPWGRLHPTFMKLGISPMLKPFTDHVSWGEPVKYEFPHDIQWDDRVEKKVYGAKAGLVVNEEVVLPYEFVKRIRQIEGGYIITHEKGVVVTDMSGKEKQSIPLPRPFGVFHLEM